MRRLLLLLALLLPGTLTGCGYHAVGAATHLPASVRTIYVPVFATHAQAFHTEMAFTQAVIRELDTRTRYVVLNRVGNSDTPGADAILRGTILSQTASPLTYDSTSGQTSSYLITVTARVVLTDRNGRVLYQNDAMAYREQYQSTQDLSGFIQEDGPAVQRIARDFAHALVSNILESF
jgi:outer membrane lipopolysaccharide assembly protein LptE/RlpB